MKRIYLSNFVLVVLTISLFANNTFALEKNTNLNSDKKNSIIPLDNKYGWDSILEWKQSRERFRHELKIYELYKEKKQSHLANCLKSVLAPGWGHFSAKSYTKGEVLLGLQIFLAGSSLYFYDKSMDLYDKYKNANQIDDMNQYYTDANSSYKTSQILIGFCAIVWGYTILDVVQATENYNRNLWEKLKLEYKDVELSLTPQGISIQF
ncbi:MAG: hypothetical protein U9R23_07275 [Candidatus Cloacimonadota bacterium]|nr:hypothetical protein [Candidatus Cloacimonadota bacterium]